MGFDGKKTERVLMRVPEDLRRAVEELARYEERPVNHQYRLLIKRGLEQTKGSLVMGTKRQPRQPESTHESEMLEIAALSKIFAAGPVIRKRRAG